MFAFAQEVHDVALSCREHDSGKYPEQRYELGMDEQRGVAHPVARVPEPIFSLHCEVGITQNVLYLAS